MNLLDTLKEEQAHCRSGSLYHQTQIMFAYNNNRIEGSHLSHEQTRYLYETNTFLPDSPDEIIHADDIVETVNHFEAFNFLLDSIHKPLSPDLIKQFHAILKKGTSDARNPNFRVGDYKALPNMIGEMVKTCSPQQVPAQIEKLLHKYQSEPSITVKEIVDFHYHFEKIHPFQDGNGRVGRLIMFRECLVNHVVPFIIDDEHKLFYYRGLSEYPKEPGYLIDTCLSAQDKYQSLLDYFQIGTQDKGIPAITAETQKRAKELNADPASSITEQETSRDYN